MVLKADQAASLLKFPMSPLSCSLQGPLMHGSPLLSAGPPGGLQLGSSGHHPHPHHHPHHHLPLDLHLHHQHHHHRNSKLELHGSSADGSKNAKKGRRSRTVFTELQLMGLEKRFEKQKYLSTPDRIDLAESLGLSQLQVKDLPKGRPKKNSIPSSEQLSEQEKKSRDLEQDRSPSEVSRNSPHADLGPEDE
ncbi:hypothetical protein CRUP_032146 [Coryphaenoides rupestris]|nr:hypothetical protein CRUP_032146 [Coryphaenoides rupestris]